MYGSDDEVCIRWGVDVLPLTAGVGGRGLFLLAAEVCSESLLSTMDWESWEEDDENRECFSITWGNR